MAATRAGPGGRQVPINKPLPPALPFTVDVWEPTGAAKPQFLTHAHKDHTAGIVEGARHIVCNPTTLDLVRIKFPGLAERLDAGAVQHTPLEPWETLHLAAPPGAGGGYPYSVTSLPLNNHCAGATMLLAQSDVFGSLLHTGD